MSVKRVGLRVEARVTPIARSRPGVHNGSVTAPDPHAGTSRRAHPPARDVERAARRRRAARVRLIFALAMAVALVVGTTVAVSAVLTAGPVAEASASTATPSALVASPAPPQAEALPAPTIVGSSVAAVDLCADATVTAELAAGDDAAVIVAAGGPDGLRQGVAAGSLPCVSLSDPGHVWTVVNKTRPFQPVDYEPSPRELPVGVRSIEGGTLRSDAAAALSTLVAAAAAEGAGEIALESGYRSYVTQQNNFGSGGPEVEASVARPGYSEHQSGLAADVVACDGGGCGTLDDLAATPQGAWTAANAWRFGWIVRYEAGRTDTTGYIPEPWHLRYIGTELARAYHDGGWLSLEEFFGLPAAPTY